MPDGFKKAMRLWYSRADRPERVQYILGIDEVAEGTIDFSDMPFDNWLCVVNRKAPTATNAWNATALKAEGKLLITVADDWFPCEHWDTELLKVIPNLDGEYVVDLSTGGNDALLTFSVLTRKYFNRLSFDYGYQGGFFYPGYIGMYADNDFDALARRDGVVIRAKHLYFEHDHPLYTGKPFDEIYNRQHRNEAFDIGRRHFLRRLKEFNLKAPAGPGKTGNLAIMVPGESFSQAWLGAYTTILTSAIEDWRVSVQFGFSSNVYMIRQAMFNAVKAYKRSPDLVLWMDDDQILPVDGFKQLLSDMEEHPELAGVCGWSWCEDNIYGSEPRLSFGAVNGNGKSERMTADKMRRFNSDLIPISYSGFPTVLMRGEVFDKLDGNCFAPVFDAELFPPWGYAGEDVSFFMHAAEAGLRFAVDRRVKVPHLKLRCAEPVETASLAEAVSK